MIDVQQLSEESQTVMLTLSSVPADLIPPVLVEISVIADTKELYDKNSNFISIKVALLARCGFGVGVPTSKEKPLAIGAGVRPSISKLDLCPVYKPSIGAILRQGGCNATSPEISTKAVIEQPGAKLISAPPSEWCRPFRIIQDC